MGWTVIPGATRDDVVRELLNDYHPVDHELCDDILWAVVAGEGAHQNLIVCFPAASPKRRLGLQATRRADASFLLRLPASAA